MISCEGYATKQVAVLGLGKSGLAAARALCRSGARVSAWDDGEEARAQARAEGIPVRDPERVNWAFMDALVISPGIPHTYPAPHPVARMAKDAGVPIIGDVELLCTSGTNAPMAAITGTNGKSTTTALLGHILEDAGRDVEVGGNLGPPICDMAMMEHDGAYVLELSSYQLELCPSARFKVAVLLNVTPDHLDRHGGMNGYLRAKKHIFHGQGPSDAAVINVDSALTMEIFEELQTKRGRRMVALSTEGPEPCGVYVENGQVIDDLDGDAVPVMKLAEAASLPGRHNAQNIIAAYASARLLGVAAEDAVAAIRTFPGLAHRQEVVAYNAHVTFVNDSKATNAEAASNALACYDDIYWIVGGKPKETGLDGLEPFFSRVRKAFLIGEAADAFAAKLDGQVAYEISGDLDTATRAAAAAAMAAGREGVVLLSPACASFDQFRNFEHRGDAFRQVVEDICAHHGGGTINMPMAVREADA